MSPTPNWTIGANSIGSVIACGFDHIDDPEPAFPESIRLDWTLVAAPPEQFEASVRALPSPEPESNRP